LVNRLKPLAERIGVILLEATGGFERPAAAALCAAGLPVMVVNPRQARDFAKSMGYLSKTDAMDARVLSHFGRTLHQSAQRERLLMKLPDANQEALEALLVCHNPLVAMRVAEANRLATSHPSQHKSIKLVLKMLDRQIAVIDKNIDGMLKEHFAEKLALFKDFKGVGPCMQAALMGALPELGQLTHAQIGKLVGVAPLNADSGRHKGKRITSSSNRVFRGIQNIKMPLKTLDVEHSCSPPAGERRFDSRYGDFHINGTVFFRHPDRPCRIINPVLGALLHHRGAGETGSR
jgi:transposase